MLFNLPDNEEGVNTEGSVANGLVQKASFYDDTHDLVVSHVEHRQVSVYHDHPYH